MNHINILYIINYIFTILAFSVGCYLVMQFIFNKKKTRVLLFGLSGNPPTGDSGHRGIIKYICNYKLFDEIWILPVYAHTFNSKKNLLPFETRMELCRLNFEELETCRVLTIERDLFFHHVQITGKENPVGTIELLKYLRAIYNSIEFTFCLGADTFNDLLVGKWNDNDEIISTTNLLVINRTGYNIRQDILANKMFCGIRFLLAPNVDQVSSTAIKSSLLSDQTYAKEKLYEPVYNYIKTKNLYC